MKLSNLFPKALQTVKSNAPDILTAFGISGVVTTAYLTGKGAFKAAKLIEREKAQNPEFNTLETKALVKEQIKLTWQCYIPAGVSGAVTIGCIVAARHSSSRRTTAAVTAYSLTERAFSEYKDKVVEQIGEGKEQKIRDELAQDRMNKNQPGAELVVISGKVLCCELYTGRSFYSDMETLRKAQNDINAMSLNGMGYVNLDEFYDLVGLSHTSQSDILGWNFERNMELIFSTTLTEKGEPCLSFEYNYVKPLMD